MLKNNVAFFKVKQSHKYPPKNQLTITKEINYEN